jgi:hypothetical protein
LDASPAPATGLIAGAALRADVAGARVCADMQADARRARGRTVESAVSTRARVARPLRPGRVDSCESVFGENRRRCSTPSRLSLDPTSCQDREQPDGCAEAIPDHDRPPPPARRVDRLDGRPGEGGASPATAGRSMAFCKVPIHLGRFPGWEPAQFTFDGSGSSTKPINTAPLMDRGEPVLTPR